MLGRRHVYHVSPFASTPHRSSPGYAHSPPSPWSYEGFRKPENEKSYTIKLFSQDQISANDSYCAKNETVARAPGCPQKTVSVQCGSAPLRQEGNTMFGP